VSIDQAMMTEAKEITHGDEEEGTDANRYLDP
jgi:hypothetical protein